MKVSPLLISVASAWDVQYEDVTVGGYLCKEHQEARVYYPDASGTFPIISWAHGFNNPGTEAYDCYKEMLRAIAGQGYVVIASESSQFPLECADEWKDQIRSIEWAKTSSVANRIDFSKAGLIGHSMGGGATYHGAGQADAVQQHNIGAAVALHPEIRSPIPFFPEINPLVPIFFGTGSADNVVSPSSVKSTYDKVSGVPKVFSEIQGAVHDEPQCDCGTWTSPGKQRHTPYAIAMFDCHLKGQSDQCTKIYGDGTNSLCHGEVPMTICEHANEPALNVVV